MKVGDLVKIKKTWEGYEQREVDYGKELIGIIRGFMQDLQLDENLDYKWLVQVRLTDGRSCEVFQEHIEVISEISFLTNEEVKR